MKNLARLTKPLHRIVLASTLFGLSVLAQNAPENFTQKLKLTVRSSQIVSFDSTIKSALVVESPTLSAVIVGRNRLQLTGLDFGETLVIVVTESGRKTLLVEVIGIPINSSVFAVEKKSTRKHNFWSGSLALTVSPPLVRGTQSALNQKISLQKRLKSDALLRIEADVFKPLGAKSETELFYGGFGFNRMSVSLARKNWTLLGFDSELTISPLSFNGYAMRGVRLISENTNFLRGAEFFAGSSQPSPSLLSSRGDGVFGALVPVAEKKNYRLRAGVSFVRAAKKTAGGDFIWQADGRFSPDEKTLAEGEIQYARNAISGRGKFEIRRGAFNFSGEASHLSRRSPLISIGAQSAGRDFISGLTQWIPTKRLFISAAYTRSRNALSNAARVSTLNGSHLQIGASYRFSDKTQIGARFMRQEIASPFFAASAFKITTDSFSGNFSSELAGGLSNSFEGQYFLSREAAIGAKTENGFAVRDEVRRSWEKWTATGYLNYSRHAQSLSGLLIRNPTLLPEPWRSEFINDPKRFLTLRGDELPRLLPGIALPQTGSAQIGARLHGGFSRLNVFGETRYSRGAFGTRQRADLLTAVNLRWQFDPSNSLGANLSRIQDLSSANAYRQNFNVLTFSYTHNLSEKGGGFRFGKLFGLDRGIVGGRVFLDRNSNGKADADEKGIVNIKVQLNDKKIAVTDADGRFEFKGIKTGRVKINFLIEDLGENVRVGDNSEREIFVEAKESARVDLPLTSDGFIAGRAFNDADAETLKNYGISGLRLYVCAKADCASAEILAVQTTGGNGVYEFRNLSAGEYFLFVDAETLPPDFQRLKQTSWKIKVSPLRGVYQDVPMQAQRRVAGIMFIDRDGDGKYTAQIDRAIEGAKITAGEATAVTDADGAYLLRNLPSGKIKLQASAPFEADSQPIELELDTEPCSRRNVNFIVSEREEKNNGKLRK